MATAHLFKVIISNIHLINSISSFLDTELATEISLGSENTEWEISLWIQMCRALIQQENEQRGLRSPIHLIVETRLTCEADGQGTYFLSPEHKLMIALTTEGKSTG